MTQLGSHTILISISNHLFECSGYRAKFITETARSLESKPEGSRGWLQSLRNLAMSEAGDRSTSIVCEALMTCSGVGRKVADCVALFSLDQSGCIPVDTHVWEITIRDYAPHLQMSKSLTPKIHDQVADIFREKFGDQAGWAHSVLFAGELPEYSKLLPQDAQIAMKEFSKDRKKRKVEVKQTRKEKSIKKDQQQS